MGSRTWIGFTVLIALLWLAVGGAAAPSEAQARLVASRQVSIGPALAGSRVVWGQRERGGAVSLWRSGTGRPVRLALIAPPKGGRSTQELTALVASRAHLAYILTTTTRLARPADTVSAPIKRQVTALWAGRIGGRLRKLSGFGDAYTDRGGECEPATAPSDIEIQGRLLGFVETAILCHRARAAGVDRVVLTDLPSRRRRILAQGYQTPEEEPTISGIRIAGRLAAWLRVNPRTNWMQLVVYDRPARRTVSRITSGGRALEDILGFGLQSDGKVALTHGASHEVAVFSRSGRRLDLPSLGHLPDGFDREPFSYDPLIAHDRFAFERATGLSGSELAVSDLRGNLKTIARFGLRERLLSADFDGRRIVWALTTLGSPRRSAIFVATLARQ